MTQSIFNTEALRYIHRELIDLFPELDGCRVTLVRNTTPHGNSYLTARITNTDVDIDSYYNFALLDIVDLAQAIYKF